MRGPNIPNSGFYSFNDDFEKPTGWTFYDELVPQVGGMVENRAGWI